jgi:polygalacturonase
MPLSKARSRILRVTIGAAIGVALLGTAGAVLAGPRPGAPFYDVRTFGAKGDGRTIDSPAINRAIAAAAAAGGGTVQLPAGTYLSFSIRLKSNITLLLDNGATLLAGDPTRDPGHYDSPEPNAWDAYQDFGHSHWQNSLIWGIGLENVAIVGPGLIDGRGLTRQGPGPRRPTRAGDVPLTLGTERAAASALAAEGAHGGPRPIADMEGQGNKAIALRLCRNVTLRDLRILRGGHFAILLTGVDHVTIDNLRIDTNRDGIDVDCCRDVHIAHCSINTPNDDAIVLKSSYALGAARATENVTIADSTVSGYDPGTMLDGTFGRTQAVAPDRDGPTGRIKLGTESNGGFKNVAITNCVFDRSRGLAIETVDGAVVENVVATDLLMREVTTAPIFLRLGNRGRGPEGTGVGAIRRVRIADVVASDVDWRFPILLAGMPEHLIEDVELSNIRVSYRGGGTRADAQVEPAEREEAYPEPSMFGTLPAYGLFVRHVRGLVVRNVFLSFTAPEERPAVLLQDTIGAALEGVRAPVTDGVPVVVLKSVRDLDLFRCPGVADGHHALIEHGAF